MSFNGPAYVGYSADDFIDGTWLLTPWAELAYRRICDFIYRTGDQLPDDDAIMRVITKAGGRWKRVKAELVAAGKIIIEAGRISNRRCRTEIEKALKRRAKGKKAAETRYSPDAPSIPGAGENAQKVDAHEDAPSRREESEKDEGSKNANPAITESHVKKALAREAGSFQKFEGFGSEVSGSGPGPWARQSKRDEYATTKCIRFLPGRDDGERWGVAMAAESPEDPNHISACRAMRRAAKKAGVGWVSPERRKGVDGAARSTG
jgi:uncharacterized protein YdaU (DUF1376 family)